MVVDQGLLGSFRDQWSGVEAAAAQCAMQPCQCLITIYKGSIVTFEEATVQDLSVGNEDRTLPTSLVCVTGGSQVGAAKLGTALVYAFPLDHVSVCSIAGVWLSLCHSVHTAAAAVTVSA